MSKIGADFIHVNTNDAGEGPRRSAAGYRGSAAGDWAGQAAAPSGCRQISGRVLWMRRHSTAQRRHSAAQAQTSPGMLPAPLPSANDPYLHPLAAVEFCEKELERQVKEETVEGI